MTAALTVHTICARLYYKFNSSQLGIAAALAVRAGSEFLPEHPRAAVWAADAYVRDHGVGAGEIVFTGTAADNQTLTIRLDRKVPWYVALFAVGLPSHDIAVTATARHRGDHAEAELRRASW